MKNNDRLALVRTINRITIPPNTITEVNAYYDKQIPYRNTSSILQSTTLSPDYKDIDVEPTLRPYNFNDKGIITVKLSNITTRTITLPPKTIICEVQPVTIEAQPKVTSTEELKLLEEVDKPRAT